MIFCTTLFSVYCGAKEEKDKHPKRMLEGGGGVPLEGISSVNLSTVACPTDTEGETPWETNRHHPCRDSISRSLGEGVPHWR
ncbi:hypothetical protein CEXT_750441 [Caerostris extrusa]|uniref:Secreted protein n=1 Tax=Caerostris extrusa TaxID=172846 RepID=A0AAV4TQH5_CAEEX|nr:hypothetical protein CEXT_750441 [Caerostris extrusa]